MIYLKQYNISSLHSFLVMWWKGDKQMKLRHLFATLSLAVVAGAGVAAGLSSGSAQKAEASAAPANTRIYFDLSGVSSWWSSDHGVTKIHIIKNSVGEWTSFTRIGETQVYYFTLPAEYDSFIISRSAGDPLTDWVNQTFTLSYGDSYNYVKVNDSEAWDDVEKKNKKTTDTSYVVPLVEDEKVYLTLDNYQYDWFGSSAHTTLHFFNNCAGDSLDVNVAVGSQVGNTLEFTMPSDYLTEGVTAVRHGGSFDPSNWDATVWNQSVDMTYSSSNKAARAFVIKTLSGEKVKASETGFDSISADYFAKAFSCYFLQKTNGYCNSSIEDNISDIQDAFDDLDALWVSNGGTANDVKTAFLTADITRGYDIDFGNNYTAQAISRYANLVEGSYTTAFLGAYSGSSSAFAPMVIEDKTKYTVSVIFASLVALTAIGGFFFFRRKRA